MTALIKLLLPCAAILALCFAPQPLAADGGRLVLAIYYPWYGQSTWTDPLVPDRPLERYNSSDPAAIARQVEQAKGAAIDGFISAWYGPRVEVNQTETNLRTLLTIAAARGFKVAAGVETGGPFFRTPDDIRSAVSALLSTHATKPAYLRWNGKPVVFFTQAHLPAIGAQSPAAVWNAIRQQADPERRALWIAEGLDTSLIGAFDGGFLYSVAWASDVGATERQWAGRVRAAGGMWVGSVMPGWDDTRLLERPKRYKRDRQDGAWYRSTWAGAASANPEMMVITSWNEFVENTYIEPSAAYGNQYLDLTRALATAWKNSAPLPAPQAAAAAARPRPIAPAAPKPAAAAPPATPETPAVPPLLCAGQDGVDFPMPYQTM